MKICTVCGYQNTDATLFCYNCGSPFPKAPAKKSKAPLIIAVVFAVIITAVGGLFALNLYNSRTRFDIPELDKLRNNMTQNDVKAVMGSPDRTDYTSSSDSVFGFGYDSYFYNYQLGKYSQSAHLSFSTRPGTLSYAAITLSYEYYFDDNRLSEDDLRILENYKADLIEYFNGKLGPYTTDYKSGKTIYRWTNTDGSETELRIEDTLSYDYMELWWNCKYESRLY